MTARRTLSLALLAAAALSCSEATAPTRTSNYEWRLFVDSDTLSFHWPASMLPVTIWVEDSLGMPAQVEQAVAAWKRVFLYGEYDAVLVSDSSSADIVVRVAPAPVKLMTTAQRLNTVFPGCEGATDIDTASTRYQLQLPVRMYLTPRYAPPYDLTECFRVVARHELGHSLGLFQHSSDNGDIMFPQPEVTEFSARDINTAQVLSHWPANLIPTR
ncbi:MAG TPA: matrixin family metalloprotease [Gemmatimonadales bacterium]|nr:matrixin family metalloprotease [Gemmatimonadales bacterium]